MDASGSSDDLDLTFESSPSEGGGRDVSVSPHRPSPFTLRSQCGCGHARCPMGTGIQFRSRISPSPSKQRVWGRRRRRSDQSTISNLEATPPPHHHHHHHHHYHHHTPPPHHHTPPPQHHLATTQVYRVEAHYDNFSDHIHDHTGDKTAILDGQNGQNHIGQTQIPNSQNLITDGRVSHGQNQIGQNHIHGQNGEVTRDRQHENDYSRRLRSRRRVGGGGNGGVVELSQKPRPLERGEMLRQRSRTPRTRKKGSTPTKQGQKSGGSTSGNEVQSGGVAALAQSVKKNVLEFFTPTKDTSLPAIVESSESGFEEGILFGDNVATSSPASDQFVCAREFFQDRQTREKLTSDFSSSSSVGDTPSKLRESTHRLSIRKPFNQYIAYSSDEELDDWMQQPKSDYTYSASLTYRERVSPDRKIGSPNMSRRGLRGAGGKYIGSKDFSTLDTTEDTDHLELRTRSILKPMDALSDTSDGEEMVDNTPVALRLRSSRSRSRSIGLDVMSYRANGSTISRTQTSTTYTTTKTLHRGLDVESDVEDSTEASVPCATPIKTRGTTPIPRAATPVCRSSTPLGRAATPLGRAGTPGISNLKTSSLDNARGGYTLAKGAIAEDVEEEEEENTPKNRMMAFSRRTWQRVTWITTVVTTSVVMMVTRAVTARRHEVNDAALVDGAALADGAAFGENEKKTKSSSFMSTITLTTRRVTSSTSEFMANTRERLRKNPLLLWIPLLFLLLLLALVAYWWLLQSRAKTDDDIATDLTEEPSFLSLVMNSTSELTHLVINGVSQATHSAALGMTSWLLTAWSSVLGAASWLVAALSSCLYTAWGFICSMFSWLGSMVYQGLSYLVYLLYLTWDFLQYLFLAVIGFFSSSVSYVYGLFFPLTANTTNETTTTTHDTVFNTWEITETEHEKQSQTWNISGWVTNAASLNWASNVYTSVSEGAKAMQNWAWSGWMWLILSVADALTTAASYLLGLLGALWSLICYLVSGLWATLAYIIMGTVSFLTSSATTVTSMAVDTSSAVARYSHLAFLFLFKSSENNDKLAANVAIPPSQETEFIHIQSASVDELVRRVLDSGELKTLIANVATESSTKGQLAKDDIVNIVRSVVEGEVGVFKTEVTNLHADMKAESKLASEDTYIHIKSLKTQQEHLLQQLEQLSAGLNKVEGTVELEHNTNSDHRAQYEEQLVVLRKQMEELTIQLKELENNQSTLATKINQCCKNASLTLADVERHVALLIGDVFGMPRDNTGTGGGTGLKAEDMAAWLRSYFVAKDELEARLNTIMANLKTNAASDEKSKDVLLSNQEAVAQTTQIVMDSVLEKLRGELQKQQVLIAEQTQEQVAQQVQKQVEAAAVVLGEQVSKQLKVQLDSSKQHLQETVLATIDENIPSHIAAALPEAVAIAVSDTVAAKVPIAVEAALPGAVNIAMEGAVDKAVENKVVVAVTEAVNGAVPQAVNVAVTNVVKETVPQAVSNSVPDVVKAGIPEAIIVAMQEAVATEVERTVAMAVPGVVASFLPAAVNDSVASAVSAAFVKANINKAGDRTTKVTDDGEEGIVVLAGSSSNTVSTTVNISKNSTATSNNGGGLFGLGVGLNETAVIHIVQEALKKYDADKTGMVDHALESAGGNIISTRCTESYQVHQAEVSILGFPIYWYSVNNPRTIIQPDRQPGQCWAFKGSQGYIVVRLAGPVKPTGFTMEHIPKSLSPTGSIDSAPREFEVWGLHSENDEGVRLGNYMYRDDGEPLQYFAVKEDNQEFFPLIELKINSNHGNLQYTCLYRFRVHGVRFL